MIEVLAYLRANQFETFIVTGGGQDFVRAYSQRPDAQAGYTTMLTERRVQLDVKPRAACIATVVQL
jgi:hypothetical protein